MNRFLWKEPAVPRHVVQLLVLDDNGKVLVMHRSNNVRSARNVWSIPTGEHEIGETVHETAVRELKEEYGLDILEEVTPLFEYENIAGDKDAEEQYHWVIGVYMARVTDVSQAINREPEKHDELEFVPLHTMLASKEWKEQHTFHESLDSILVPYLIDAFA